MKQRTALPIFFGILIAQIAFSQSSDYDAVADTKRMIAQLQGRQGDWPQAGGSSLRNSVTDVELPTSWDLGSGENIKWVVPLGSTTYGNPVIADGKIFVGTNNGGGYVKRLPKEKDLGVLLCFEQDTGKFLWQHSSEKLAEGSHVDWPDQGICSTPIVVGDRLYFVTNRGEVVCLDTAGFQDNKNDGDQSESEVNPDEADTVWSFNMMEQLKTHQHYMANCSITCAGDLLFVCTSQGVDADNNTQDVPSFFCLNRQTGQLVWTDNSSSLNVLHGQWSSPAYAELEGVGQVIFGGGDGWLYSFDAKGANGKSKMLWKFDCNPKSSKYTVGGGGDRNYIVATPTIYDGKVYIAVGDDPEFGSANGRLWCIDPSKRGDVSSTLVYNKANPEKPIAHKRMQALVESDGDFERPNPNSAAIWQYTGADLKVFEKTMHRGIGGATILNDILVIADFGGIVHCLNAQTGQPHWTYDMFSACWAAPLIAGQHIYVSDEEGDIAIFALSEKMDLIAEINMESAVLTTPTAAGQTLYISSRNQLIAIQSGTQK